MELPAMNTDKIAVQHHIYYFKQTTITVAERHKFLEIIKYMQLLAFLPSKVVFN